MSKRCLLIPALWGDFNAGLERTMALIADGLESRGHSVEIAIRTPIDLQSVRQTFGASLTDVKLRQVSSPVATFKKVPLIGRLLSGVSERLNFGRLTSQYDLVIVQNAYIPPSSKAKRSVLFTEFPRDTKPSSHDWRQRLGSYDLLIGNSEFTCSWIRRYWETPCEVFYPSVQQCIPLEKEQTILGVGRFTEGGRDKGQLQMTRTFRRLVDGGLEGWRLQLAGIPDSADLLEQIRELAVGYPVDIELGPTAEQLAEIYGKASIFWHTTGLGVDVEQEPQRLEHFGIVVAEAMTAGCVPLVFGAAGPREIVADDDLCWTSLEQLEEKTLELINAPARMSALGENCRRSAVERFGTAAFDRSVDRLLGG